MLFIPPVHEWIFVVLQPEIFMFLLLGFFIGILFGTIPGLTSTLAVALLLPITFGMDPLPALVTATGIYSAGIWSSSITAHVINIPGAPGGAISGYEGYQLTLKGQVMKALRIDMVGSVIGGLIGGLLIVMMIEPIAEVAVYFRSPEKFSLIILSLIIVSLLYTSNYAKGIIATTLGALIATIGFDIQEPTTRGTLGIPQLIEGIDLLVAVVGVFVIAEILLQIEKGGELKDVRDTFLDINMGGFVPRWSDFEGIRLRGFIESPIIGMITGILPGAGATMASIITYGESRRVSKEPEKYGKGSTEGIFNAEAGNNAMCPGAVVPLIIFGIPGDAVTAVMLGILLIHGLVPGPSLLANQSELVGPMLASFIITPFLMIIALIIVGPALMRLLRLNMGWIYGFISVVSIIGIYAVTFSTFQVFLTIIIGLMAWLLSREGYPRIPLIMGFILGPLFETFLRASLQLSGNNPMIFLTRPISVGLLILSVVFIYAFVFKADMSME